MLLIRLLSSTSSAKCLLHVSDRLTILLRHYNQSEFFRSLWLETVLKFRNFSRKRPFINSFKFLSFISFNTLKGGVCAHLGKQALIFHCRLNQPVRDQQLERVPFSLWKSEGHRDKWIGKFPLFDLCLMWSRKNVECLLIHSLKYYFKYLGYILNMNIPSVFNHLLFLITGLLYNFFTKGIALSTEHTRHPSHLKTLIALAF